MTHDEPIPMTLIAVQNRQFAKRFLRMVLPYTQSRRLASWEPCGQFTLGIFPSRLDGSHGYMMVRGLFLLANGNAFQHFWT